MIAILPAPSASDELFSMRQLQGMRVSYEIVPTPQADLRNFAASARDLAQLHRDCSLHLNNAVRKEAALVANNAFQRTSPEFLGFEHLFDADVSFGHGNYVRGFQTSAQHIESDHQLTSTNPFGIENLMAGLKQGQRGNYGLAEVLFRKAHFYATPEMPFAETIYYLGIAKQAQGFKSDAEHTWCLAINQFGEIRAQSSPSVNWNLLMARRIGGEEISDNHS